MAVKDVAVVKTQMLIRKPVAEVFEAFVNPEITTRFWFTRSTGRLEPGTTVRWDWEMYGVWAEVSVKAVEPNKRLLVEWDDPPSPVEWQFAAREDGTTLVIISNWDFQGSETDVVAKAIDHMEGFSLVLAGLKAWLEHGVALNLVADAHPDSHVK